MSKEKIVGGITMVNCTTCGHLKFLHTDGKACRAIARDRTSKYKCNYQCTCGHFYPEHSESKIQRRVKQLEKKALSECWEYCYDNGLTEKERSEYNKLVYGRD